jgi:hypothetical protein
MEILVAILIVWTAYIDPLQLSGTVLLTSDRNADGTKLPEPSQLDLLISQALAVSASLYIFVRGLTNIDDAKPKGLIPKLRIGWSWSRRLMGKARAAKRS